MIRLPHIATIPFLLSGILLSSHSFQPPLQQRSHFPNRFAKPCTFSALQATPQPPPSRRRRVWRWCQRKVGPLAVAMAFATARTSPSQAARNNEPTHSLRPGMTQTQAQLLEEGALKASDLPTTLMVPEHTASPSTTKTTKPSLDYGDIEDDEDDEDLLLDQTTTSLAPKVDSTKRQFAAYHQPNQHKGLTLKVGAAFFLPTYGTLIVREWYRRRREEAYVQKGLEILEAQKAEYFNITSSTQDSDVSDELKKLKNNETNAEDDDEDDDDDDDDDDDEEEEDEDQPPRRRRDPPRKPSGDGGSPSSTGGGTDDKRDPGYGKPSDEDLDRLNKIFGKS